MLVIQRRLNESIVLGDNIVVKVLRIGDNYVRLGIVAPRELSVHRDSVYDAIHGEGKAKEIEQCKS